MKTLKPITAQQITDYSGVTPEQAEPLAAQYNEQWAGRTWQIVDGTIIYGSK